MNTPSDHSLPAVIVVPVIPSSYRRGGVEWGDVKYAQYALPTWRAWGQRHGIPLVVLDQSLDPELPPSTQRYRVFEVLDERGLDPDRVLMVDADTMVRWDTPPFFGVAGDPVFAVHDHYYHWIHRSVSTFAPVFPGVALPFWDYYNCGMLVFDRSHRPFFDQAWEFFSTHRGQLQELWAQNPRAGTDQTPVNYLMKRHGLPIRALSPQYNLQHCVPYEAKLRFGTETPEDIDRVVALLDEREDTYDFAQMGFVWHFNSLPPRVRVHIMRRYWERIRDHYET